MTAASRVSAGRPAPAQAAEDGAPFSVFEGLDRDAAKGWSGEAARRVALGADTTGLAF